MASYSPPCPVCNESVMEGEKRGKTSREGKEREELIRLIITPTTTTQQVAFSPLLAPHSPMCTSPMSCVYRCMNNNRKRRKMREESSFSVGFSCVFHFSLLFLVIISPLTFVSPSFSHLSVSVRQLILVKRDIYYIYAPVYDCGIEPAWRLFLFSSVIFSFTFPVIFFILHSRSPLISPSKTLTRLTKQK